MSEEMKPPSVRYTIGGIVALYLSDMGILCECGPAILSSAGPAPPRHARWNPLARLSARFRRTPPAPRGSAPYPAAPPIPPVLIKPVRLAQSESDPPAPLPEPSPPPEAAPTIALPLLQAPPAHAGEAATPPEPSAPASGPCTLVAAPPGVRRPFEP